MNPILKSFKNFYNLNSEMVTLWSCRKIEKICVLTNSAEKIMRNKPQFCVLLKINVFEIMSHRHFDLTVKTKFSSHGLIFHMRIVTWENIFESTVKVKIVRGRALAFAALTYGRPLWTPPKLIQTQFLQKLKTPKTAEFWSKRSIFFKI